MAIFNKAFDNNSVLGSLPAFMFDGALMGGQVPSGCQLRSSLPGMPLMCNPVHPGFLEAIRDLYALTPATACYGSNSVATMAEDTIDGVLYVAAYTKGKIYAMANDRPLSNMDELPSLLQAEVVACNNIRPNTCALYKFLGWQAERLPHYYRLGQCPDYQLAKPMCHTPLPVQQDLNLKKIESSTVLISLGMPPTCHTPHKDIWYLQRRYFNYPHFHYDVWAAQENGELLAYLVTRTVTAQDTGCAAVVRLVDFIGEDAVLPRLGGAIDAMVCSVGAEYIDCYNAGIPAAIWQAAGFTERVEGDGCIIPNYLTPPLRENTEYYYFTNKPENFVLFKADGDQDRPNLT